MICQWTKIKPAGVCWSIVLFIYTYMTIFVIVIYKALKRASGKNEEFHRWWKNLEEFGRGRMNVFENGRIRLTTENKSITQSSQSEKALDFKAKL